MTDGTIEYQLLDFNENYCDRAPAYYSQEFNKIIQSYDTVSQYALTSVPKLDILAIVCRMFEYLLKTPLKMAKMLEISDSFDSSAYFAAKTLESFSVDNFLYCCETWLESEKDLNVWKHSNLFDELASYGSVLRCLSGFKNIATFKANLQNDTEMLQNSYFDIILISGGHGYQSFVKNVIQSIKILKPNGILISYNCNSFKDKEYAAGEPSVMSILNLLFKGNSIKSIPYSTVWSKEITENEKFKIQKILEKHPKFKNAIGLQKITAKLEINLKDVLVTKDFDLAKCTNLFYQNGKILMRIEKLLSFGNDEINFRKLKYLAVQAGECNYNLIVACKEKNEYIIKQLLQKEISIIHSLKDVI